MENHNRVVITGDDSSSVYSTRFNENYHSINGAITESKHVFIANGLEYIDKPQLSIFELGFGTGLNALLSYQFAEEHSRLISYTSIEKFPLNNEIYRKLNYCEHLNLPNSIFQDIHDTEWNKNNKLNKYFSLRKINADILSFHLEDNQYDVVFFDAFSPDTQNDLWTTEIFSKFYEAMKKGGVLVTYSAKGIVKRNLRSVGFSLQRLKGPPGKHHMLRAVK